MSGQPPVRGRGRGRGSLILASYFLRICTLKCVFRGLTIYFCPSYRNLITKEVHCKKRLAIFPSPAGMSLTKLYLAGIANLFYSVQADFWYLVLLIEVGQKFASKTYHIKIYRPATPLFIRIFTGERKFEYRRERAKGQRNDLDWHLSQISWK
jgi:hypothetical protein